MLQLSRVYGRSATAGLLGGGIRRRLSRREYPAPSASSPGRVATSDTTPNVDGHAEPGLGAEAGRGEDPRCRALARAPPRDGQRQRGRNEHHQAERGQLGQRCGDADRAGDDDEHDHVTGGGERGRQHHAGQPVERPPPPTARRPPRVVLVRAGPPRPATTATPTASSSHPASARTARQQRPARPPPSRPAPPVPRPGPTAPTGVPGPAPPSTRPWSMPAVHVAEHAAGEGRVEQLRPVVAADTPSAPAPRRPAARTAGSTARRSTRWCPR